MSRFDQPWTPQEDRILWDGRAKGIPMADIARRLNRTPASCEGRWVRTGGAEVRDLRNADRDNARNGSRLLLEALHRFFVRRAAEKSNSQTTGHAA